MISDAIDRLKALLQGRIPAPIETDGLGDENERQLAGLLNQLISSIQETHDFILPLSKGQLDGIVSPSRNNLLGSPFKELHSRLLHLTWQAKQVADGDYSQRVDFMGDFSEAFNFMIIALEKNEKMLRRKIDELQEALSHISKLEGILPICSNCKKIRLDGENLEQKDSWVSIESYISNRTVARFTHSICPECVKRLYPDLKF